MLGDQVVSCDGGASFCLGTTSCTPNLGGLIIKIFARCESESDQSQIMLLNRLCTEADEKITEWAAFVFFFICNCIEEQGGARGHAGQKSFE